MRPINLDDESENFNANKNKQVKQEMPLILDD